MRNKKTWVILGMLVFVFYRDQHEELLKLWLANKRDNNNG